MKPRDVVVSILRLYKRFISPLLPPACLSGLTWEQGKPESNVVVAEVRPAPVAVGRPAGVSVNVQAAAAYHAVTAGW